jgi:hypothetical protein
VKPVRALQAVGVSILLGLPAFSEQARLSPRLRSGQSLVYRIDFSSSRETKTESRVVAPQVSPGSSLRASVVLQVHVVEAGATGVRLETYLSESPYGRSGTASGQGQSLEAAPDKRVDLFIAPDGTASQVKGLNELSAAQQFAWSDWLGRFASSMSYPTSGIHPRQRWESTEAESAPSPIVGLKWTKKYQYVRDEPCRAAASPGDARGKKSISPESCAVIFVQAILRQTSSPKNATPPDFKLQNLATRGTANGRNETVLYISKSTGLLIRSTEDAQQAMNVVVALADGSNQVRYDMTAKSHSQVELLPDSPQEVR